MLRRGISKRTGGVSLTLIGQNTTRTKQLNKEIVFEIIRKHQPIPRHEIAEKTLLTRGTISNIVSDLIAEDLIKTSGTLLEEKERAGRRSVALKINSDAIHIIGIHISMRYIQFGLINLNGDLINKELVNIAEDTSTDTLNKQLLSMLNSFLMKINSTSISAIGVGVSGLVNQRGDVLVKSNHLGIKDYPIAANIQSVIDVPVYLENNAKAMANAEKMFGVGKSYSDFLAIYLGEGIGSGMVINDKLFHGNSIGIGEFGHMTYLPDGIRCWCGNRGCIERYTSEKELLKRLDISSIHELYKKVDENNSEILRGLESAGQKIGITLTSLLNMLRFPVIIFSGNLADKRLPLLSEVERIVNQYSYDSDHSPVLIHRTSLGSNIGLLGAASLALTNVFNQTY